MKKRILLLFALCFMTIGNTFGRHRMILKIWVAFQLPSLPSGDFIRRTIQIFLLVTPLR